MDAETCTALEASIKHWEENVAAESWVDTNVGWESCALCLKFIEQKEACTGCPVQEKTGRIGCWSTPYNDAAEAINNWEDAIKFEGEWAITPEQAKAEWVKAATVELEFLKSLRPKE